MTITILVTVSAPHVDPTLSAVTEGVIGPYTSASRRVAGDGIVAWIVSDVQPGELAALTADVASVWQDGATVAVFELGVPACPA
jgi:hypothetical protein